MVRTREPGGTEVGEKLRSLVLDHGQGEIGPKTEALIFAAARSALVSEVIRPALATGEVVICDRYIDSSLAYQGVGRHLGIESVLQLNEWATDQLHPDLTIVLDVSPIQALGRRELGSFDRLESEAEEFHRSIRAAFIERARLNPQRYLLVDGQRPINDISSEIRSRVLDLIGTP